jgi:hypothetical protein
VKVVEEKTIISCKDELIAMKMKDGSIHVPVRRLCDNLGIDWPGQWQRIQRDEVLSDVVNSVGVTPTQSAPRARSKQEMICLPLKFVPGWLFGIAASRVNEGVREKLIRYRRECYDVLWTAFKGDMLPELQEPTTELTPAENTLAQAEAFYHMAHQQVVMERWLKQHDGRLDAAEERIEDVESLVEDLRLRAQGPKRLISDRQAAELAAAVKAIASQLTRHDKSRNWYQSIYNELCRRFGVSSYRQVSADQFGAVMAWLNEYAETFGGSPHKQRLRRDRWQTNRRT